MPFKIDRVPQGLLNLLATRGGGTPAELEDRLRSTIDVLQMYALQQVQRFSGANAALAENVATGVVLSATNWAIIFSAAGSITKTATMTALRAGILLRPNGDQSLQHLVASAELGPFGATETGATSVIWEPAYPRVVPPATAVLIIPQIIGTDANCAASVEVFAGLLG